MAKQPAPEPPCILNPNAAVAEIPVCQSKLRMVWSVVKIDAVAVRKLEPGEGARTGEPNPEFDFSNAPGGKKPPEPSTNGES